MVKSENSLGELLLPTMWALGPDSWFLYPLTEPLQWLLLVLHAFLLRVQNWKNQTTKSHAEGSAYNISLLEAGVGVRVQCQLGLRR